MPTNKNQSPLSNRRGDGGEALDTQPSLFGFQRPRFKYPPITKQRIQEAKALMAKGDLRGVYETLRDLRYKLEDFEKRIR